MLSFWVTNSPGTTYWLAHSLPHWFICYLCHVKFSIHVKEVSRLFVLFQEPLCFIIWSSEIFILTNMYMNLKIININKNRKSNAFFYFEDKEFPFYFCFSSAFCKTMVGCFYKSTTQDKLLLRIVTKLLNAHALKNIFHLKHWVKYSVA